MVSTFLENTLNLRIFTHASRPHLKLSPKLLASHNRQREITQSPSQSFFEICLSQQQNLIRRHEHDLDL